MKLTRRQKVEEEFHDHYAKELSLNEISLDDNFSLGAQENRFARKKFGNLKGKRVLDLGCGTGETAVYWSLKGARVDGVDISSGMVLFAKNLAKKNKVTRLTNFIQMRAENLTYKSDTFDVVFGNGVLHHVNLEEAVFEVNRVLKKGGIAIFIDPLSYNPVINLYRSIAKEVRTPMEGPLSFKDIEKMKKVFQKVDHKEFQLFTLLIFIWFFIVDRISPNRERYWKKITHVSGVMQSVLRFLIKVDEIVLKMLPPLRYLCWNTVTILEK